jgi:6-phosphogluconolactonase
VAEIRIVEDPAAVVAERLGEVAAAGGQLALSGGSTPRRAFELAAAAAGDWSRATLWYVDDRAVPPDAPDSNHRLVAESLLAGLSEERRPEELRIEGERGYAAAADAYEELLRARLGDAPVLDLVLLGLGPDGHTASLFPGRPEVEETQRLVVGVPEAGMEPYVPRVSLTLPVINAAREVVFLVAGEGKAEAMRRAFGEPPDPAVPGAHVQPRSRRLVVVCDAAAAGALRGATA